MRPIRRPVHPGACLVAILLTLASPYPTLSEPHQQQVFSQPGGHPENQADFPSETQADRANDDVPTGSAVPLPDTVSPSLRSPLPLTIEVEQPSSSNLGNLTNTSVYHSEMLAPCTSSAAWASVPSPHPSPHQQAIPTEDPPKHPNSNSTGKSPHQKRSFDGHRRNFDGPTQTWPGTDTVYATKTIFISQTTPTSTVYVSNGQVITTYPAPNSSPTPYVVHSNNNNVWVTTSGSPNIVVATVTAMSSAHKFAWDDYYSSHISWWTMMVLINLMICFFTFIGFGFVTFGL
ncbi:hypothetical protein PSTG_10279 [Puccinia striiformis f. sp. tritici PST-78]|uniref:Transmembrane protein n=1 Tax=Puccinia striiformis f. sp. tritici PST-78 TaxID=1165861 RepID=A0A0L0VB00_9BASI|nr:hypothetical protein PSTG_10279 [Puccinia striiformis f. sp. tritici PST-78]